MSRALAKSVARIREHGQACAVRSGDAAVTYERLCELIETTAEILRASGLAADEAVLLEVENDIDDITGMLAILAARGVVVPVRRASPQAARDARARATGATLMVSRGEVVRLRPAAAERPVELRDAAFVIFTSGSTGEPKGVVLGQHEFAGKLDAVASVIPFRAGVRTLVALQMSFAFGIWVTLLTLRKGGTVVFAPLAVGEVLAAMVRHEPQRIALVPTLLRAVRAKQGTPEVDRPLATLAERRCVHDIITGGESLGHELSEAFQAILPGARFYDVFGLTETSTSDFILPPGRSDSVMDCVGWPTPGVSFRLVDENGAPVPGGGPGELEIRTPYRMRGYIGRPDLTEAALHDGYVRTGDLACVREDGALQIVGRVKDIVGRAGLKIAPFEVERMFGEHPAVAAALAVGMPDPVLGEALHVAVTPREGCTLDEAELLAWAAQRLEQHLRPDRLVVVSHLPTGETGKLNRARLRELLEAKA